LLQSTLVDNIMLVACRCFDNLTFLLSFWLL